MISYSGFAEVYDKFMDNVPYDEWAEYLRRTLKEHGMEEGVICELGCGTGNITERLSAFGYDMIGIDNAVSMLSVAQRKKEESGRDILYLCQDMREFELHGSVRAVICICDGLNYLLEKEEVLQVFQRVAMYLESDGLFLFDLNTIYKYAEVLGECTIAENREDVSFIWDNGYDEADRINEYDLTLYVRDESAGKKNVFLRFDEVHLQKGYEAEEIIDALKEAGLSLVAVYDGYSKEKPKANSERLCFVVKKERKR